MIFCHHRSEPRIASSWWKDSDWFAPVGFEILPGSRIFRGGSLFKVSFIHFFFMFGTQVQFIFCKKTSREKENKYLTLVPSLSWIIAARTYKFASNVKSKDIFWTSYWISFLFATYSQEDLMLVQCLHNHSASGCLEITFHHTTLMERSRVTPTLSTHSSSSVSKYRLSQTLQSARQSVKYLRSSERKSEFSMFCHDTSFDNSVQHP